MYRPGTRPSSVWQTGYISVVQYFNSLLIWFCNRLFNPVLSFLRIVEPGQKIAGNYIYIKVLDN
jgi:hypothetical protein